MKRKRISREEADRQQMNRAYIVSHGPQHDTFIMIKTMSEMEKLFWLKCWRRVFFMHNPLSSYKPAETTLREFLRRHDPAFIARYRFLFV